MFLLKTNFIIGGPEDIIALKILQEVKKKNLRAPFFYEFFEFLPFYARFC